MIDALRIGAPAATPGTRPAGAALPGGKGAFAGELARAQDAIPALRFSAHAQQRLQDRNIHFSDADRARIAESADLAAAKGSREALLLMDRLALVVGVPNRTVITVMDAPTGDPAVFTNIDSVVVMAPRERA